MATEQGGAMAVGGIIVPLGMDISPLSQDLYRATAEINAWQTRQSQEMNNLRNFGATVTASISAPINAFVKRAIAESINADQISKRLNLAIRNTGAAAGITRREIDSLGDSMLRMSNFSDESVRQAAASLMKFKGIRGQIFRDTMATSADMAAALGTDIASSAQMLGRAMENPGQGSHMLRRAGIVLSRSETEGIKEAGRSGGVAGQEKGQQLLLAAINERMSGAAKAMAEPFTQMRNAWDEVREASGAYVRRQWELDAGAAVLRDTFLGLAGHIQKADGPFTGMLANITALVTKLPPLALTLGQYAASFNHISTFLSGLGNVGGRGGRGGGGGVVSGVAEVAASTAARMSQKMERAVWMREEATRTSAKAAELSAASQAAMAGTRFKSNAVLQQAAEAERMRELAKQQHGRASVFMQQARNEQMTPFGRDFKGASGKTSIIGAGTGGLSITGVLTAASAAYIGWEIAHAVGTSLGQWVNSKFAGKDDEKNLKDAESAKVRAEKFRTERQTKAADEQRAIDDGILQQKALRAERQAATRQFVEFEAEQRKLSIPDTLQGRIEYNKSELERARLMTSVEQNKQMMPQITENFTATDVDAFQQSAISRWGNVDTEEAKAQLTAAKESAAKMFALLGERGQLEKERIKAEEEATRQIALATKDVERIQSARQLGQDTIDTVIKAALADPEQFRRMATVKMGPDFLDQMSPDELNKFTSDAVASRNKMGVGDATDLGFQIRQKDVQRQKSDLAKEMKLEGDLTYESLKEWMASRGSTTGMQPFEQEAILRQTTEAKDLLNQEDQLVESRASRIQQVEGSSTWETRNAQTAVQGTMKGYQDSIRREKPEQDLNQISKNTGIMAEWLRQMLETMKLDIAVGSEVEATLVVEGI